MATGKAIQAIITKPPRSMKATVQLPLAVFGKELSGEYRIYTPAELEELVRFAHRKGQDWGDGEIDAINADALIKQLKAERRL